MFDKSFLYEACDSLLSEIKAETLEIKKGHLFKQMLAAGSLVDGWYVVNTESGAIVNGPAVRAYGAYDKAAESGLEAKIVDIVRVKSSKLMQSKDFAGQTFSVNLPAGWYVVNKNDKLISRGPVNQSQARLHSRGDEAPREATGIYK